MISQVLPEEIMMISVDRSPKTNLMTNLKGCVRYIFASLFLSLNESTCQTGKNVFYLTSKALLKSNFKILHFQIS